MKTKLLLLAFITSIFGFSQSYVGGTYLINEFMVSPPGIGGYTSDIGLEFLEFRSVSSTDFPANTYLVCVEGEGSSNQGEVKERLNLSNLSFNSKEYLVVIYRGTTPKPYDAVLAANSATCEVYDETTVTDYDGDLENHSITYMLISSPTDPDGVDIDTNDDGVIDNAATWTIYDSVSNLDDEDSSDTSYGYGQVLFVQNIGGIAAGGNASVDGEDTYFSDPVAGFYINLLDNGTSESRIQYMARQGTSTGHAAEDWMGGPCDSGSSLPNWKVNGTSVKVHPDDFKSDILADANFGGPNPDPTDDSDNIVLSIKDSFLNSKFRLFPNPVKNILTIDSNNIEVSSVKIYNILGKQVLSQKGLDNRELNISSLSSGLYVLKLDTDRGSLNKKIVVE